MSSFYSAKFSKLFALFFQVISVSILPVYVEPLSIQSTLVVEQWFQRELFLKPRIARNWVFEGWELSWSLEESCPESSPKASIDNPLTRDMTSGRRTRDTINSRRTQNSPKYLITA